MGNKVEIFARALMHVADKATKGRIGDRIDGSIKYECKGSDGSLVLRTDHKNDEYGFLGVNAIADEEFFLLCDPAKIIELINDYESQKNTIAELEFLRKTACKVMQEFADELDCKPDNEVILQAIDDLKNKVAELEKQRDALLLRTQVEGETLAKLAWENAALKDKERRLLKNIAEDLGDPTFHADYVQTPATDAAIAEIVDRAFRELSQHMKDNGYEHEADGVIAYANKLRGGGV